METNLILAAFVVQLVLLPIQGLIFLATRREKEETRALIKEGLKQALRVIVTRRVR